LSSRAPLDGIELVLIDGNNLLHRRREGVGEAALRGVLVEIQRKLPRGVRCELVLDGHPAPGTPLRQKISPVLELRHAAGTADDALVALINDQPWASRGRTIVVTDDRALADRCRTAGALPRRLDWLSALPTAPQAQRPTPGSTIGTGRQRSRQRPEGDRHQPNRHRRGGVNE
jgi:hypothetical protein